MLEKMKANILFQKFLGRPDIDKAYAMVPETDAWYDTIRKVHDSLAEIQTKPHELLELTSRDGLKLKAVYYPNSSQKTVICVHGYTSHAEREWAFPGLFYLSMGYNVLIPYQRAHGLSEGKYISFGALERLDMADWVSKVNGLHPQGQILIHGLSMGGAIVLNLSNLELENVKCLIADAPNTSIQNVFQAAAKSVFKKNSDKVVAHISRRFKKEFGCDMESFESLEMVKGSRYPLLLSAGSMEKLEETFAAIEKNNPMETEQIILPGCNHGNGMYKQTELYQGKIKIFTEKYI